MFPLVLDSALIGGTCTITAGVVTAILNNKLGKSVPTEQMQIDRQNAITGTWKGRLIPDGGIVDVDQFVEVTLTTSKKIVTGTGRLELTLEGEHIILKFRLSGGFAHSIFLKLDYFNSEPVWRQFGSVIFTLSDNGRELTGKYVGYGPINKGIVSGGIILTKQP